MLRILKLKYYLSQSIFPWDIGLYVVWIYLIRFRSLVHNNFCQITVTFWSFKLFLDSIYRNSRLPGCWPDQKRSKSRFLKFTKVGCCDLTHQNSKYLFLMSLFPDFGWFCDNSQWNCNQWGEVLKIFHVSAKAFSTLIFLVKCIVWRCQNLLCK